MWSLNFFNLTNFYFLVTLLGMRDLSSPTREEWKRGVFTGPAGKSLSEHFSCPSPGGNSQDQMRWQHMLVWEEAVLWAR